MKATNPADPSGGTPEFPLELRTNLVRTFKLLADETRLLILFHLLQAGELNVTELCNILGHSQPAISHHISLLREVGLLQPRKEGKHNYYSVCCDSMCDTIGELFQFLCDKEKQELKFHDFTMTKKPPSDENNIADT